MIPRKPKEVTAPVIPPDQAFALHASTVRDNAVAEIQRLKSLRVTRCAYFDREIAKLEALKSAEVVGIDQQLAEHERCEEAAHDVLSRIQIAAATPRAEIAQ